MIPLLPGQSSKSVISLVPNEFIGLDIHDLEMFSVSIFCTPSEKIA